MDVVKGWIASDGFPNIPQYEYSQQITLVSFADAAINDYIWQSGVSMYLQKFSTTTLNHVGDTAHGGASGLFSVGNVDSIAIVLYSHDPGKLTLAWYMVNNGDVSGVIDRINQDNFPQDFRLFRDTVENAGDNYGDIPIDTWDSTPEMEDSTDDNVGGEFADLMPFNTTDTQSIADIASDLGWDLQDGLDPYSSSGNSFFTPYVLSAAQFAQLGYCMFSSSMWNTISQWFNGPENVLQGILRVLDFPCYPAAGAGANIAVCGQDIYYEASPGGARTYASGNHLGSRYKDHNLGSIPLKEVWGSARDYTDTKVQIFLPFVGLKELDAAQCIGHVLTLLLRIDFWTGDIVYILNADNDQIGGKWFRSAAYIGRWTGNCAAEIPVGRQDNSKALSSLLGGIGAAAGGLAMATMATTPMGATMGLAGMIGGAATAGGRAGGMLAGGLPRSVSMQGNLTGNTGVLDILYPYIIVQRAVPDYPIAWRAHIGAPRNQRYKASDLSGYTLFDNIFLVDVEGASGEEIEQLKAELCSEGIIL